MKNIEWEKPNILKTGNDLEHPDDFSEEKLKAYRRSIEPWLTAIFQSDHLTLLAGTGLSIAAAELSKTKPTDMSSIDFGIFNDKIKKHSDNQAKAMRRGKSNIEDNLRVAIELYKGLSINDDTKAKDLKIEIDAKLLSFINMVLESEKAFVEASSKDEAMAYLKSFIISFASRTASRDRLNIVTTNYDRFIEYICDKAGILILDNFTGKIEPSFRTNKLELDYHYNPPGIRGEPRYVEGVTKFIKLHGSLDWRFENNQITQIALPFGADKKYPSIPKNPYDHVAIYPNSYKGIETLYFPYAELFREFSTAVCQPNSVVVTFGYGFGDSHINRILEDMLTIPSTHLVVISWDKADGRISNFIDGVNPSQYTLLIGSHFGNLKTLVDFYLPKAAIDRITERKQHILEKRGEERS